MSRQLRPRVLVAHAGRQHSHRTAAALAEGGWLAGYWSGIPLRGRWGAEMGGMIEERLHRSAAWSPGLRRILTAALPGGHKAWATIASNRLFDRWSASRLRSAGGIDAVIGYEGGCERLFREARRQGIVTILDAAAVHHRDQWEQVASGRRASWLRTSNRIKEAELAEADAVLTVSEFAWETYLRGGLEPERVRVVPLGVDLSRFSPGSEVLTGEARFCFVGSTVDRKGLRELDAAVDRLLESSPKASLRVAGAVVEHGRTIRAARKPGWQFLGKLRGEDLVALYRSSDALLLPSLEDSFGLVVPEALACGTPVLVSDRTGARDLVREGENGWVIPAGDSESLHDRLAWMASNVEIVRGMRKACAESVRDLGWGAYSAKLLEAVGGILRGRGLA